MAAAAVSATVLEGATVAPHSHIHVQVGCMQDLWELKLKRQYQWKKKLRRQGKVLLGGGAEGSCEGWESSSASSAAGQ